MTHGNIQHIYDEYVARLSEGERLRLIELITRGMVAPGAKAVADSPTVSTAIVVGAAGWQPTDRREMRTEWRDRAL